jgi:MoaA/NifB/PqqE/SkfB family radical SAM enzyme
MRKDENKEKFFVFYPQVQLVSGTKGAAAYDLFGRKLFWFSDPLIAKTMTFLAQNKSVAEATKNANSKFEEVDNYLKVLSDLDIGMIVEQKTAVENYRPLVLKSQAEEFQLYRSGGTLTVELTGQCVYNCPWCTSKTLLTPEACSCGVWSVQGKPLSIDKLISTIEELNSIGVEQLIIRGGEPMLEPERLLSVVSTASRLGMHSEIHTTGTLLTDDMVNKMQKLSLSFVLLIAAEEANEFDTSVGLSGSWLKLQDGIKILSSYKMAFCGKVPVSLDSPLEITSVITWLKGLGVSKIMYLPFLSKSNSGTPDDIKAILGPVSPKDMAVNLPQFISNGQCHYCFDHSYFIAADGKMSPCIAERNASADLSKMNLSEILREKMLSSPLELPRWKVTECKGCEFRLGCRSCAVRTNQIKGTSDTRHWNCRYSHKTAEWA